MDEQRARIAIKALCMVANGTFCECEIKGAVDRFEVYLGPLGFLVFEAISASPAIFQATAIRPVHAPSQDLRASWPGVLWRRKEALEAPMSGSYFGLWLAPKQWRAS